MGAAILAAIIISVLYFGRDVFIPIALAILLSFVLAPIVRTLQDWHTPRGFSIITVVLLAFLAMFAVGGISRASYSVGRRSPALSVYDTCEDRVSSCHERD